MEFKINNPNTDAKVEICNLKTENQITTFDVVVDFSKPTIPKALSVFFNFDSVDVYALWSPSIRYTRFIGVTWEMQTSYSRLASWMPLHTLISAKGDNRLTIAISDAKTPTSISTGIDEGTALFNCVISFFTIKVAPLTHYTATVRLDCRSQPYYDSIYEVTKWWEKDCGYTPAYVPEHAKLPMNSLWYSYHHNLSDKEILKQCKLSKEYGLETVIVDDGWQSDTGVGYITCGDWNVSKTKFPNFKNFITEVHNIGLKVMLWFSVPFIGIQTKNYQRFKNMLLDQVTGTDDYSVLDPRYKEVRDYLIETYSNAVKMGLDGLKLDFIDWFCLKGKSLEYDEKRDYQSLEDAIDRLMIDITNALREINPEILIEFRQTYVGPAIRKYGNMLRVGDCPNDCFKNRNNVINLRFTSGDTAVHSDMLTWSYNDKVESAALQVISVLYSVPQISVKLDVLNYEHKKMLNFYMKFWRENRDVLLFGKLFAYNPESGYSQAGSLKNGNAVITCYTNNFIDASAYNKTIVVNSSKNDSVIIKGAINKNYSVVSCM
ncbi:MAG: alpha-galactosidase, partial [Clostridia bacterium]|nr:alpha-galactosidase [Clostridia bacterium]